MEGLKRFLSTYVPRLSPLKEHQQDDWTRFENDPNYFNSQQFIDDLFNPPNEFVKQDIPLPEQPQKDDLVIKNQPLPDTLINTPSKITNKQITQEEQDLINNLSTSNPQSNLDALSLSIDNAYKKAAEEVEQRAKSWQDLELAHMLGKGLSRALTGTDEHYYSNFKLPETAKDVIRAPLDILKERDKGVISEATVRETISSNDPNSEESKMARQMYADLFESSGMKAVADQIRKSSFSAKQLEEKFSKFNISNILSQKMAADTRKELKMLGESAKKEDKQTKEMFSMESKLRSDAAKDIQKTAMTYEHLEKFKASMAAIKEAIAKGDTTRALDASGVLFQAVRDLQGDNSVVRKSDYDTIIGGLGPINKLKMEFNAALGKGYITPNIYNNLVNAYKSFQKAAQAGAKNVFKPHFTRAQKYGIDPRNIFPEHINKMMLTPTIKKRDDGTYEVEE